PPEDAPRWPFELYEHSSTLGQCGQGSPWCGLGGPTGSSETADAVAAEAILSDDAGPNLSHGGCAALADTSAIRRGMATRGGSADHDAKGVQGRGFTISGTR